MDYGGAAVNVVHKNDMRAWHDIACQRGHETHASKLIDVLLAGQSGYQDYPPIPARLARSFEMMAFEWRDYRDGPYCPGHDAVSETVDLVGIWEPRETILALTVFESALAGSVFLDLGAQIGWFSLLAASAGLDTISVDADAEPLRLLANSAKRNGWEGQVHLWQMRIDADTPVLPAADYRLAKLDMEGAEFDGIRILWPSISAGLVEHILMEISPVFSEGYPELVTSIMQAGYRAYMLPGKSLPPHRLVDPERDLMPLGIKHIGPALASWSQEMMWFRREDTSW